MISWMQKHKKYLVITIWISTIAFVGAGFVGWGAYKFGTGASAVAEVGDRAITVREFQRKYQELYSYYNRIMGGKFDREMAKKYRLEEQALQTLIQEALLENFASDHGLIVTEEEVAKRIASMEAFADKKGEFSKEIYLEVLRNNRMKPKDFEEEIEREILLEKVLAALQPKLFDLEFNTTAASLFIGDKIEYKPLDGRKLEVEVKEEELKSYHAAHKGNYLTPARYRIALIEVEGKEIPIDEGELKRFYEKERIKYSDNSGKILPFEEARPLVERDLRLKRAKREALKRYVALKKGEIQPERELVIDEQNSTLPPELLKKVAEAAPNQTLKPIRDGESYLVVKLLSKEPPKPMEFTEARPLVERDLRREKRIEKMEELAERLLKEGFHGIKTDYICRDDVDKLKELEPGEAALFLKELFISRKPTGAIPISQEKMVLYKILDQKLVVEEKVEKGRSLIAGNGHRLKSEIENRNLLNLLQQLYEIKIYYKGS
ncbi:MAG: hypothetical protein GXO19_02300 [Epsilonproteobacteria bacterium]|nr:hypothetical protein [Campylobacterota bacterium]NPA56549.1 hypothetical protein [Campylobacterota bacterium]